MFNAFLGTINAVLNGRIIRNQPMQIIPKNQETTSGMTFKGRSDYFYITEGTILMPEESFTILNLAEEINYGLAAQG